MRVRWTTDAADDLERVCDYIAETSPDSARRVARTIVEGVASLETFRAADGRAALKAPASSYSRPCPSSRSTKCTRRCTYCESSTAPSSGRHHERRPESGKNRAQACDQPADAFRETMTIGGILLSQVSHNASDVEAEGGGVSAVGAGASRILTRVRNRVIG